MFQVTSSRIYLRLLFLMATLGHFCFSVKTVDFSIKYLRRKPIYATLSHLFAFIKPTKPFSPMRLIFMYIVRFISVMCLLDINSTDLYWKVNYICSHWSVMRYSHATISDCIMCETLSSEKVPLSPSWVTNSPPNFITSLFWAEN